MNQGPLIYILDTSALLTFIEDEAGADQVQELLEKAKRGEVDLLVSFMSFMEVYYISLQERGQAEAQERVKLLAALPIVRTESSESLGIKAGAFESCSPSISSRRLDCGADARTGRGASAQRP